MLEGQKITYFGVCLLLLDWYIMMVGFDDGRNSVGLMLPYLFFVLFLVVLGVFLVVRRRRRGATRCGAPMPTRPSAAAATAR